VLFRYRNHAPRAVRDARGADDFVETVVWGKEHLAFLRRFYRYENDIPSHDTLCDVFAALDPDLFKACFLAWAGGLRDTTRTSSRSMGKPRGAAMTGGGAAIPCIWFPPGRRGNELVLGQQATEEKSNEITAIHCC